MTNKTFTQWQQDAAKAINSNYSGLKPNEYNTAAHDFLFNTGTIFKAEFKSHSYYFPDDKETRDVYNITLTNRRHKYRFTFGQSISNQGEAPTPYDVLACLTKYEVYSFEDFCGDYGYDQDSRKAYKTYKAVKREWENVDKLFTSEELEQLREIN